MPLSHMHVTFDMADENEASFVAKWRVFYIPESVIERIYPESLVGVEAEEIALVASSEDARRYMAVKALTTPTHIAWSFDMRTVREGQINAEEGEFTVGDLTIEIESGDVLKAEQFESAFEEFVFLPFLLAQKAQIGEHEITWEEFEDETFIALEQQFDQP